MRSRAERWTVHRTTMPAGGRCCKPPGSAPRLLSETGYQSQMQLQSICPHTIVFLVMRWSLFLAGIHSTACSWDTPIKLWAQVNGIPCGIECPDMLRMLRSFRGQLWSFPIGGGDRGIIIRDKLAYIGYCKGNLKFLGTLRDDRLPARRGGQDCRARRVSPQNKSSCKHFRQQVARRPPPSLRTSVRETLQTNLSINMKSQIAFLGLVLLATSAHMGKSHLPVLPSHRLQTLAH